MSEMDDDVMSEEGHSSELNSDYDSEPDVEQEDLDEGNEKGRKRANKFSNRGFILEEAEEESESDYYDESEVEEGFNEAVKKNKRLDSMLKKSEELNFEEIANRWVGKTIEERRQVKMHGRALLSKHELLPSSTGPFLFMVRCRIGDEVEAVHSLMRKYAHFERRGKSDTHMPIISAVHLNNLKGYIYIEAFKKVHVQVAISDNACFKYSRNNIFTVPLIEMTDVLRVVKNKVNISPKTWVQVKKGMYKNDVCFVDSVDHAKNSAIVRIIPRIDYSDVRKDVYDEEVLDEDVNEARTESSMLNKVKKLLKIRPKPQLFDVNRAKNTNYPVSLDPLSSNVYIYRNNKYYRGLLYKRFLLHALNGDDPTLTPGITELNLFEQCGVSTEQAAHPQATGKIVDNKKSICLHDVVVVVNGDLKNLVGKVTAIDQANNLCTVQKNDTLYSVNLSDAKKHFAPGDSVIVISAPTVKTSEISVSVGTTGLIVKIGERGDTCVVYSEEITREFEIETDKLQLLASYKSGASANVADGAVAVPNTTFKNNDFVRYDGDNVGIVIGTKSTHVTVLDMQDKLADVPMSSLAQYVVKRQRAGAIFKDMKNNSVKVGDTVRVASTSDPHYSTVGQIRLLYKDTVFVYARSLKRSSHLFATQTKMVVLESSCSLNGENKSNLAMIAASNINSEMLMRNSDFNAGSRSNVGQMSPTLFSDAVPQQVYNNMEQMIDNAGEAVASNLNMGTVLRSTHDVNKNLFEQRGKTARITVGQYKGYYGIVRDINLKNARIQLHSNTKMVTVPINSIVLTDGLTDSKPIEFVGQRQVTASAATDKAGVYAAGGMTPHYGGGLDPKTPIYMGLGGGTTPYHAGGMMGAATPLYMKDFSGAATPRHDKTPKKHRPHNYDDSE